MDENSQRKRGEHMQQRATGQTRTQAARPTTWPEGHVVGRCLLTH